MDFTWSDLIKLIKEVMKIKASGIANCLGISYDTVQRVEAKRGGKFTKQISEADYIYDNLFDTNNEKCPVHKKNEANLLLDIKAYIRDKGFSGDDLLELLDETNYSFFVKRLVEIAKPNLTESFAFAYPHLEFDKGFDLHFLKLTQEVRRLRDLIEEGYVKSNDVSALSFIGALEKVINIGMRLGNPIAWLSTSIKDLAGLHSKWSIFANQDEPFILEADSFFALLLRDIQKIIRRYFSFRGDYLLSREITVSENISETEKIIAIFEQIISDWYIKELIHNDFVSLEVDWVCNFEKSINTHIAQKFEYNNENATYSDILEFSELLMSYDAAVRFISPLCSLNSRDDLLMKQEGDSEEILRLKDAATANLEQARVLYDRIRSGV